MSNLVNKFVDKALTESKAKAPQRDEVPYLDSSAVLHELDLHFNGDKQPIHPGVTAIIPDAPMGEVYNLERARWVLRMQNPPVTLTPAAMLTPKALRQVVQIEGDILWLEGFPRLSRADWINISTHSLKHKLVGAIVMLLHPHLSDAQILATAYPWIPILRL